MVTLVETTAVSMQLDPCPFCGRLNIRIEETRLSNSPRPDKKLGRNNEIPGRVVVVPGRA